MVNNTSKRKAAATLLIAACIGATLYDGLTLFLPSSTDYDPQQFLRRSLMSSSEQLYFDEDDADNIGMYPWAQYHLRPVDVNPDAEKETALFWHIPKSGGSTAKAIYKCLGKNIDVRSQIQTIEDAANLGLVESNDVDILFSSFPSEAVGSLFDPSHKGRMLAMFRNPVDRLTSKFYYLQIATWEKTYRPEWKELDIMDWVNDVNIDNNHMVKKLAGKIQREDATELDLLRAKNTIRQRMIVGLMTDMEESFNRFNKVLNINENTDERYKLCMDLYFGGDVAKKSNSNSHPRIDESHPAYQVLAEQNSLDLQLYEYVLKLFDEQKAIVEGYDTLPSEVEDSSSAEEAVPDGIPGTVVSSLAEDLSQYSQFSSEVIVPDEESSSSTVDENIQVDTNDESPETQIAANNDESTLVEASQAAQTSEEELSPLHQTMIAEALKTQTALEAAVDEVFQPKTTHDEEPELSGAVEDTVRVAYSAHETAVSDLSATDKPSIGHQGFVKDVELSAPDAIKRARKLANRTERFANRAIRLANKAAREVREALNEVAEE